MEVTYRYYKKLSIEFRLEWRDKYSPMGRFGGGWNWEVGFQLGSETLILNLLVFSIIITIKGG